MNPERYPLPPPCAFDSPSNIDIFTVAAETTSRVLTSLFFGIIIYELPAGACLSGLRGGYSAADTFALMVIAQNFVSRDLHLVLPRLMRHTNLARLSRVLGPTAHPRPRHHFPDFTMGNDGIHERSDMGKCLRAAVDGMLAGLRYHGRALSKRLAKFDYTATIDGLVSVCFSPREARMQLRNRIEVSTICSSKVVADVLLPVAKLQRGLMELVQWYMQSEQTTDFDRLFVFVSMGHKPVLVIYDRFAQNWACIDPQLSPGGFKGMRIAVACPAELPTMCKFICEEIFTGSFNADLPQTPVVFAPFVVGPGASEVPEEWEAIQLHGQQ